MPVHGTLSLVRRKRNPPAGMRSQASSPHGSATAINGLRRPQRDVVLSERRPMIAPDKGLGGDNGQGRSRVGLEDTCGEVEALDDDKDPRESAQAHL